MTFEVVKGSATLFTGTVYSDDVNSIVQDLTGATVKAYIKSAANDPDGSALAVVNCTVTTPTSGVWAFTLTSALTNPLTQSSIVFEVIAKLADGATYIKSGVQTIKLLPSADATLF